MKRFVLAAATAFASSMALAQTPSVEVAKPDCGPEPQYPGREGMQAELRRKTFEKRMDEFKACMLKYIDDRKATIKANEAAANKAIEDFNGVVKRLNEAQEAAR